MTDLNMNRLPESLTNGMLDYAYEVRRARELLPIWKQFRVGFDIHSMARNFPPMIMNIGPLLHRHLIAGFPIDIICSNIHRVQRGFPAAHFYGNGRIPVLAIEAGHHEESGTFENARVCTIALLQNLGMIVGRTEDTTRVYREYHVEKSVIFPDATFALSEFLTERFEQFHPVKKGDVLAESSDRRRVLTSPIDGHALLHTRACPIDIKDEAVFLSRPVREIVI